MIQTLDYLLPDDLTRTLFSDDRQKLTWYQRGAYIYNVLSNTAWDASDMWLLFQVRPKWICLIADTGNALPGVKFYTFSPGYWMPRECEVGWTKHFRANKVEHFDESCQSMGVRPGPYTNTLLSQGIIDLGGDLGPIDCITLEYHKRDEQHTYGKGLGMVRWSKPGWGVTTFNNVLHAPCRLLPVCGRS